MNTFFRTIFPMLTAGALAITAESCGGGESDTIDFVTRADSTAVLLPDYLGDSAYVTSRYSVVWPEKIKSQDFDAFKDSLVNITFGTTGSNTFDQAVAEFMKQPLLTAMDADTMTTLPADYTTAMESLYITVNDVESNVSLLSPDLLVIDVAHYSYMAHAAHGMSTLRFLNYSIKEHTLLTPDNFFTSDAAGALGPIIKEAAQKKYSENALFADATYTIDNFRITEENVEFVYQPYDVGPYASGIITVALSHYDVRPYLTPVALSTLGL